MSQRQHFVPRVLINGFLDPVSIGSERIEPYTWVSESKGQAKKKSPGNILWEREIYTRELDEKADRSLEDFFSRELEKPFAKFKSKFELDLLKLNLQNLEAKKIAQYRRFIVEFVFWHWKRTRKYLNHLHNVHVEELERNNSGGLLTEYIGSPAMKNDTLDTLVNIGFHFEDKNIIEILLKRDIIFTVVTNKETSLIGSDNPVLKTNAEGPDGFIYPKTEVTMALTSKIIVSLYGDGSRTQVRKLNNRNHIRRLNQSFAMNSERLIYGASPDLVNSLAKYTGIGAVA